jgi:hypothetical protein
VDVDHADPDLFLPLTEGERADALRLVTETKQLRTMVKVGRYRVIAVDPLALKPPHERAGKRLARVVFYDYASDARVDATVDLEGSEVFFATTSRAQPMLSPAEEADAIGIAVASDEVTQELAMGDEAQGVMHYWSRNAADIPFSRRSAAVLFGQPGSTPSLVAVVDLVSGQVSEVVPAHHW